MTFRISNEFGFQEPYWGSIGPIEAMHSLEEGDEWKLKYDESKGEKKISRVHNYRFVQRERDGEERKPLKIVASQIMSYPVVTLTEENTLEEAWEIAHKTRFRHIPIVNKEGMLVGILSDRTLLRDLFLMGGNVKIKEVMTTKVISAAPNSPIQEIAQLFFIERIGSMPITDEQGHPVGIITRGDILRTVMHFI